MIESMDMTHPDAMYYVAFLDGVIEKYAIAANKREGWVDILATKNGLIPVKDGSFETLRKTGKVEIKHISKCKVSEF